MGAVSESFWLQAACLVHSLQHQGLGAHAALQPRNPLGVAYLTLRLTCSESQGRRLDLQVLLACQEDDAGSFLNTGLMPVSAHSTERCCNISVVQEAHDVHQAVTVELNC